MDDVERRRPLWKNLKQRLGLKGMGCCGPSWVLRVSEISIREEDEEDHARHGYYDEEEEEDERRRIIGGGVGQIPAAVSGMNLASALEAERNLGSVGPATVAPLKSLMRLFEETDGGDLKTGNGDRKGESGGGVDGVCCVCMEKNKGAAFIPCGHTYCRVCSRELWLNRGSCPLCNRSITEILDIF